MAGGIGSAISGDVVRQLNIRKDVIGKTSGKTREDLLYTTSKTGWVKLSSSVNTLTDEEAAQLKKQQGRGKINGSNTLAGYNILMGGLLDPNRNLRAGIDTTGNYNSKAAYNTDLNSTGLRPMPGITSMNVKSKNTYGTLREAEVKFICWTLEDFERMDKLYLRPGFTMMLEWGHSLYLNEDGKLETTIETVPNGFFANGVTMTSVLNTIRELRHKSSYNYEGMIGYVKNFSWNYTTNGGYECTVTIISTGEILESLQIKFDPKQRIPVSEMENPDSSEGREQKKSIYHYFIQKLQNITDNPTFTKKELSAEAKTFAELLDDFTGYYYEAQMDDTWMWDEDIDLHWVPLRTVFDIFNKHITIVDLSKTPGSSDYGYVTINTDFNDPVTGEYVSSKYITSPEHFSIDPMVCVLPKTATVTTVGVDWLASIDTLGTPIPKLIPSIDPQLIKVDAVHDNLRSFGTISTNDEVDDVLNILVSMPFLKAKLDEALDVDGKRNKSVLDIFKTMLEGINTALGGINDLDFTFDEDLNRYFLIDRNATPSSSPYHPTLTMAGVDSIFTDVSISSKISNEMGSQISVAAQGSTMNYSDNVDNILKWNPNIIDRMRVTKDTSTKPSPETEEQIEAKEDEAERVNDWLDDVVYFYTRFNGGSFKDIFNEGFDKDDLEAAKTMHAEWTANNVAIRYREANNQSIPGLVPVELSFKTDGIGGLKIGEAFKIKGGILPTEYQGKFGYIITGLEHSLDEKGRWETSVTTQFYLLGNGGITIAGYGGAAADPTAKLLEVNQRLLEAENAGVKASSTKGGTIRSIEGVVYKNGQMPDDKLRYINNWKNYVGAVSSDRGRIRLYTAASRALDKLLAAAETDKVAFKINGAYRTIPDQERIKARYGPDAAEPGTSNHGFGLAVDFSTPGDLKQLTISTKQYKWLKANASKYGFRRLGFAGHRAGENWEAWHWEYQI
jgi:hypothetical protein